VKLLDPNRQPLSVIEVACDRLTHAPTDVLRADSVTVGR
jgi:hypothetical protein